MLSFKSFLTINFNSKHLIEQAATCALKPLQTVLGSSKKVEILKNDTGKLACHTHTAPSHTIIARISLAVFAFLGAIIGIPLKALSIIFYHDKKEIQFLNNVLGNSPSIYQAGSILINPYPIYSNDIALAQEAADAYNALKAIKKQIADPFFTETRSLKLLDETQEGNRDLNSDLLKHIDWFPKLDTLDTGNHFTRDLSPTDEEKVDFPTKMSNFQKSHQEEVKKLKRINPQVSFTLTDHTLKLRARRAFTANSIPAYIIGHCQTKSPRAL